MLDLSRFFVTCRLLRMTMKKITPFRWKTGDIERSGQELSGRLMFEVTMRALETIIAAEHDFMRRDIEEGIPEGEPGTEDKPVVQRPNHQPPTQREREKMVVIGVYNESTGLSGDIPVVIIETDAAKEADRNGRYLLIVSPPRPPCRFRSRGSSEGSPNRNRTSAEEAGALDSRPPARPSRGRAARHRCR